MQSASLRAHAAVPFMNPLGERVVDPAIAALALPPGAQAAEAERYDDEEAVAYAARIRTRRAVPGGTSTLGFALLTLRR